MRNMFRFIKRFPFLAILIVLSALFGCATTKPLPVVVTTVKTVKVKVPVIEYPKLPTEVLACRTAIPPAPVFVLEKDGDYGLTPRQIPIFQEYVLGWVRCDYLWRSWYQGFKSGGK